MEISLNHYVNYGTSGVCLVAEVQDRTFSYSQPKRPYYVLKPVNNPTSTVFVPVDNEALLEKMRPLLSREEIDAILLGAKGRSLPWIEDRKERENAFNQILSRREEPELLLLIHSLYQKSKELEQERKNLSASDAKILKAAEGIIEEAFSFTLHLDSTGVVRFLEEKLAPGALQ